MKRTWINAASFVLVVFCAIIANAQTATGVQPLGSTTAGPDAINLGNLNIHWSFPVFFRPGRGTNFSYILTYDSSIYQPLVSGSTTAWTPVTNFGWRGQTEVATGYISEKSFNQTCYLSGTHDLGGFTTRTTYAYHDPFGATHPFPGVQIVTQNEGASNCPPDSDPPFTSNTNDGSGYSFYIDDSEYYVTSSAGKKIRPPVTVTTGSADFTDTNGNQVTVDGSGNFTDTLGTVALSITGSQTAPPMSFNYHDTNGQQRSVVVNYTPLTVETYFQCANINEYGPTLTNLPTSIVYPDGSQFTISYEPTPNGTGHVTGRIGSITLRTGGVISYTYTLADGSNGIECSDGSTAGFSQASIDGTTKYDRSGSGTQWTTTVTDATAQQNQTVISFQTAGPDPVNYYETKRQMYAGIASPQSLLRTIDTCYNGSAPDCTATAITLPITQQNLYTTLENGQVSHVNAFFDSTFGRTTEVDEYDFGATSPTRKTVTTYAFDASSPCPNHNVPPDRVCSVQVIDSNSQQAGYTSYGYDETTPTVTSGVPHHVTPPGPRGNATSINRWRNLPSVATLTTSLRYDDTGNVLTISDPRGHATTFSYTDNFSDSANLNSLAYVTAITPPITHAPNAQSHTMTAKYDVNTGLMTDSYGQNNEHTAFLYDLMLRPIETDFPDGGKSVIQYQGTSQVWTWTYLDASNHTDFRQHIDSMGRVDRTALLNQEGSWDMQDVCFDSMGRPQFSSYTYQDANGWNDQSRCSGLGDTTSYDALSRPLTVQHSDSSTITYNYSGRATQIADEGNGSTTVRRILQSDALGRLTNVCEVSGSSLLGTNGTSAPCGLDYTANGFPTTYSYNALNNLVLVDQAGAEPRAYGYDSLSRMISESFPEQNGNITSYSFDDDSLLATRTRQAPNNAGGGVTTTYSYDEMHRLTGISYSDGTTPHVTYGYDESSPWGAGATNQIGEMTSAQVFSPANALIAGEIFPTRDLMGRIQSTWQCTPRTCGTSSYNMGYTYDQAGDMLTAGNGVGVTLTSSYNPAARLTGLTSSLADSSHPGTLLSSVHYGPFGPLTDSLGNGLSETYSYHQRGWLQSASFGGGSGSYATGSVTFSGQEQSIGGAYATGNVNVAFNEPSPVQVQTSSGSQSTLAIAINSKVDQKVCDQLSFGRCVDWMYNFGTVSITVNGCTTTAYWDETTTAASVASALSSGFSCSTVTASANGSVVNFTSVAASSSANYAFSASDTYDSADFASAAYWPTPTSGNMSGGSDPAYTTYNNQGTATLCLNGNCAYHYNWNQNDNATSIAAGLAAAVQADPSRVANAGSSGSVVTLTSVNMGSVGNGYSFSASSTYDSAHFSSSAATFSPTSSNLGGGINPASDVGSATLTVAGLAKSHNWSGGDTALNLANDLANQINGDPSRQANAAVISCGANCEQINLTATTPGPNPSYSGGISHTPTSNFPSPSFSASPTATTAMTGGVPGGTNVYSYSLGFAGNGSIDSAVDGVNGSWVYGYDEFNRLVSANKNNGQQTFSYDYDRFGNRWHQNAPQGGPAPQYSFDAYNHINNPDANIIYDALGNVLNDGLGHSYIYDAENRVASVNGSAYVYDAFGERVKGPSGEVLYDLAGRAVTWLDASTGQWNYGEIYAGGRHLATYSGGTTNFLHPDWLGTKRVMTAVNQSVSETCTGFPFGDGITCGPNNWGYQSFTDDVYDSESNTEHTLFRQLSTAEGRWLTPDPAGMAAVDVRNPQSLNQYSYVNNLAMSAVDPLGLKLLPHTCKRGVDPDNDCPNFMDYLKTQAEVAGLLDEFGGGPGEFVIIDSTGSIVPGLDSEGRLPNDALSLLGVISPVENFNGGFDPNDQAKPLDCRPDVIQGFDNIFSSAGAGWQKYEAGMSIEQGSGGSIDIRYAPMTYEPNARLQIPIDSSTIAIAHTHPGPGLGYLQPPSPGDMRSPVPNYVVTQSGTLYQTIPNQNRYITVRNNFRKCSAKDK